MLLHDTHNLTKNIFGCRLIGHHTYQKHQTVYKKVVAVLTAKPGF